MRVNVDVEGNDEGNLRWLMGRGTGSTAQEVVRDALTVYYWLAREQASGHRLLIERGMRVDLVELQRPEEPEG